MQGGQATDLGDCSPYPAPNPYSCVRTPDVIDLPPGVPYSLQVANCCRDGATSALAQDPANSLSSFQMTIGYAGNSNVTARTPTKLTLRSPGPEYTYGDLKEVAPTRFVQMNGHIRAAVTWRATCACTPYLWRNWLQFKSALHKVARMMHSHMARCRGVENRLR